MKDEINNLIIAELVILILIGLFLKNIVDSLKFAATFSLLYFMPTLPWIIKIKTGYIEKLILINVLGLALIPTLYIFVGSIINLNIIIYPLIPIIVFVLGIYHLRRKSI